MEDTVSVYYVVQDAVHHLSSVAKTVADLERVIVRIDRFIKVEETLAAIDAGVMDEPVAFAQFYVIKTCTPMNYIL